MDRIFSHAGVSRKAGQLKFRTSNRAEYVDILIKEGHSDLDILELTEPMSKDAALAFLLSIDFANGNAEVQATLEAEATKRRLPGYEPEARKRGRKPKAAVEAAEADTEVAEDDNVIELPMADVEVEAEVAAA